MNLTELRKDALRALNELYDRTDRSTHGLKVGAKARRLLALFDAEAEHRNQGHRELLEARASEIARKHELPEIYSYHVIQAFVELFNELRSFREATHAHVNSLEPKRRLR